MRKKGLLSLIVGLSFILLGCTSTVDEVQNDVDPALVLVNSGKPSAVLPAFTTYAWSAQYNRVLFGPVLNHEGQLKAYIKTEVARYLKTKGYQQQRDPESADVVIGFVLAVNDDVANPQLESKFGLLPGTQRQRANDARYKKGTFVLAILNNQLDKTYWRTAVVGLNDFETSPEHPLKPEDSRLPALLPIMLNGLPQAGR